MGCGWIKFFSRSSRFLANFWTALIFASLYQDKEVIKKGRINEENTFKDSVLEISGFYNLRGTESRSNLLFDVATDAIFDDSKG